MSGGIIALISVSIAILTCAVVVENRTAKSLWTSIVTVTVRCLIGVILANILETIHLLIWISVEWGIDVAKSGLDAMAEAPVRLFLLSYRRELVRLLPLGAAVAVASSSGHSRVRKVVWASVAAAVSGAVIEFLFPQVLFMRQPPRLFLVAARIVEGPIIGILVAPIDRRRIKIPRRFVPVLALLREHPRNSTLVVIIILLAVLHWIPAASRVFLEVSSWRQITVEYKDLPIVRSSPMTTLLLTLFNGWPVAGGENIEWLSFKSAKKMLNFTFQSRYDVGVADQTAELIVSRVNDFPPLQDRFWEEMLEERYRNKVDYAPQVVYRGRINPGTFTIDAPGFACTLYSPNRSNPKDSSVVVSAPLRTSFTATRERQPVRLLVPSLKEVSPTKDWISVRTSDETLAFGFWAARDLMMFCRASQSSSKEGVQNISISGQELAKPIVIGSSGGAWKNQTGTTIVYPGFLVELKRPKGGVSIGTVEGGSDHIALGMPNLIFVAGNVSTIQIREPIGSIKIGADEVKQLDTRDELGLGGENLEISPEINGGVTVQGESRNIMLDGISLAKPILPKELDLVNLIGVLAKFFR
jgi:hypothetical protein